MTIFGIDATLGVSIFQVRVVRRLSTCAATISLLQCLKMIIYTENFYTKLREMDRCRYYHGKIFENDFCQDLREIFAFAFFSCKKVLEDAVFWETIHCYLT